MSLGIINEVPDYEIVIRIAHAIDNGKLISGTLHVVVSASRGRRYLESLLKSLISQISQVFRVILISFGYLINRKVDGLEIVFGMTHVSYLSGILDGLGKFRKKAPHLSLRLNIEIIAGHAHTVLVIYPCCR